MPARFANKSVSEMWEHLNRLYPYVTQANSRLETDSDPLAAWWPPCAKVLFSFAE